MDKCVRAVSDVRKHYCILIMCLVLYSSCLIGSSEQQLTVKQSWSTTRAPGDVSQMGLRVGQGWLLSSSVPQFPYYYRKTITAGFV